MRLRLWIIGWTAISLLLLLLPTSAARATGGHVFSQTGFSIDDPAFANYFDRRGGLHTFGYPVSREFTFRGFPVQIFQRAIMQRFPDGHVQLLNLLDDGLFPYTQVNDAQFPAVDPTLIQTAPSVGSAGYNLAILQWVNNVSPDHWNGLPVLFHQNFVKAVSALDVSPTQPINTTLVSGFDLEIWGVPTSHPTFDPQNTKFVYQRYQRGIMHFDATTGATQGLLLADYFKGILMGENLPPDLTAQVATSPYYRQYNPLKPGWVDRPNQLAGTDLTRAFEPTPIVVLDPGHGGLEIGASHSFSDGTVLREKDLNLSVATKIAALLRQAGYTVVQTRTTDSWVDAKLLNVTGDGGVDLSDDLQMRVDIANNAHATLFLSTHFNGYIDPALSGTTVYFDSAQPFARRSQYFAGLIDREAVTALRSAGYPVVDRGVQVDSQALGLGAHFYVLGPDAVRPIRMPGALVEGLFLTSPLDAAQLRNPQTLDLLAHAYAHAVEDYDGRTP
jgi:N-acetylmuramoyl-L-alanine amidase